MKPLGSHLTNENVHSVLGFVRSAYGPHWQSPETRLPFVTISRQAGAPGADLGRLLVERLNDRDRRDIAAGARPWTLWDRELVEKVAADHHIAAPLVESLGESHHSWLMDFLGGLSAGEHPDSADEARVFAKVASTIRALAAAGRVVIVGRGGVFITRHMPGGVHVRLVAPLERRIDRMAAHLNCPREQAAARVREMTRTRDELYRRYWPQEPLRPDLFTATLNTAALSPEAVARVIVDLVRETEAALASQRGHAHPAHHAQPTA